MSTRASRITVERTPSDGAVNVNQATPESDFIVTVTHDGVDQPLRMSEWNARRLLGILSVMLDLPLQAKAAKTIKLGNDLQMSVAPVKRVTTLGETVARNIIMQEFAKKTGGTIE